MSLKTFHIVFVSLSALMSFGVGAWGGWTFGRDGGSEYLALAVTGAVGGVGLIIYGVRFLRKLRGVSYL